MSGYPVVETLERLGLSRGSIIEAIITTLNKDGSVNAAPMGVVRGEYERIVVKPYRSTTTCENLRRDGHACVNTTDRPELFLITAFKDIHFDIFPMPSFDGLAMIGADASIFLVLTEDGGDPERPTFVGKPSSVLISENLPSAYSRGRSQAVDAVIIATHLDYQAKSSLPIDNMQLCYLDRCIQVVRKVSPPESPEARVADAIENMGSTWREKP
jgi:hypothetical protein